MEGDDFKKLQRKAKKLGATKAKRFISVQPNTKIISFTKILIEEKDIWQKDSLRFNQIRRLSHSQRS